jgi:ABC-type glutathione transport system ATPase component
MDRGFISGPSNRCRSAETIKIASGASTTTLEPMRSVSNGNIETFGLLYARLLRLKSETSKLEPGLAENWEASGGGRTYTFRLRDAKFSDATPITAEDVVFSRERVRTSQESAYPAPLAAIESISATDFKTVGIVGESGSGKSTLTRTIVRLRLPTKGEILYKGVPIPLIRGQDLLGYRRAVQMVFQNPYDSLNPRLTVEETIAEPLVRHKLVAKSNVSAEAARLLDRVELPRQFAGRRAVQLSGGQCQRVGTARPRHEPASPRRG